MLKDAVVRVTGKVWRSQAMFLDGLLDCEEHAREEATVDNRGCRFKYYREAHTQC